MATVQLEHINKKFGRVEVIEDLCLKTREKEFSFILGPSGAGKTTILSLIAGILPVTKGSIYINDQCINNMKPRDRNIAIAFESYALYPNKTVLENIRFPLDAPIRKGELTDTEKVKRVTDIAKMLQIDELLKRYPRELSGGQRQRVALGRTLVRRPNVYLLDEPIAHLDAKLRHQMRGELKRLQQELGIPVLCSSPDQSEAVALADRIFVLNKGKIEQEGSPEDLYFHPGNEFVALMMGDPKISIFPVELKLDNGEFYIENSDIKIKAPADIKSFVKHPGFPAKIDIGLRHSDIETSFVPKKDDFQEFSVDFYQINGEKLNITVVRGNTKIVVETRYKKINEVEIGKPVWIKWNTKNFYLFDQNTKKSLL